MKPIKGRYYLINDCNAGKMIGKYKYEYEPHPFPYSFEIIKIYNKKFRFISKNRRMKDNEIIREITSEEMLAIML
jgi:hypothetical protein